jgi:cytochrome c5
MRADIVLALLAATIVAGCTHPPKAATATPKVAPDQTLNATLASTETTEIAALPDDPAKTLLTERCLLCHGAGLITQQRKDAAAWGRTVTQMRTWGTPIQDADQAALVTYLTANFGPTR